MRSGGIAAVVAVTAVVLAAVAAVGATGRPNAGEVELRIVELGVTACASIGSFVQSTRAKRVAQSAVDNTAPDKLHDTIAQAVTNVLQPVRKEAGQ